MTEKKKFCVRGLTDQTQFKTLSVVRCDIDYLGKSLRIRLSGTDSGKRRFNVTEGPWDLM